MNNDSEMFEKIVTLKSQVGFVLKRNPQARNDDVLLIRLVCKEFKYDTVEKASGIERCRRYYNHRGEYLPTIRNVAEKRKLNMENWRDAMGYRGQLNLPN